MTFGMFVQRSIWPVPPPKLGADRAVLGIERDQAPVGRRHEQPCGAVIRRRRLRGCHRQVQDGRSSRVPPSFPALTPWRRPPSGRRGLRRTRVVRQSTAGQVLKRQLAANLRIVAPDFGAGGGVQRYDVLVRRAEEKPVADLQRRYLERRLLRVAGTPAHIAGMVGPGDIELGDIGRRDLVER